MRNRLKFAAGIIGGGALLSLLMLGSPLVSSASGTWTQQHGDQNGAMHGVWFTDALHGTAVGEATNQNNGRILRTVDGGANWIAPTTEPTTDVLNRVMYADAMHGLAVGEPTGSDGTSVPAAALRTSDGGNTWTQATSGTGQEDLEGVFLFANSTAWAVGNSGTLIESTDRGDTWSNANGGVPKQVTGAPYNLSSIWFVSATEGWIGGDNPSPGGHIPTFHTTDGGANWTLVESNMVTNRSGTSGGFESMMFTDPSHGWAVGDCRSDSGGTCLSSTLAHWNGTAWVDKSPPGVNDFDLQGVWFVDATHGWVVGDNSDSSNNVVQRVLLFTADGGNTWTAQADGIPSASPTGGERSADAGLTYVMALDICHAWATGGASTILGFTDVCPAASVAAAAPALPKAGIQSVGGWAPATGLVLLALILPGALVLRRRRRSAS